MKVFLSCLVIQFGLIYSIAANECDSGAIRMTGGTVRRDVAAYFMEGGLQVCLNSQWATVCQNNWDINDATVACRQLSMEYDDGKYSHMASPHLKKKIHCYNKYNWEICLLKNCKFCS